MDRSLSKLRIWRQKRGFSLEKVCDLLAKHGVTRPSAAKLSRIERVQRVPLDMLAAFEAVTAIPVRALRPEVASLFLNEPTALAGSEGADARTRETAGAAS